MMRTNASLSPSAAWVMTARSVSSAVTIGVTPTGAGATSYDVSRAFRNPRVSISGREGPDWGISPSPTNGDLRARSGEDVVVQVEQLLARLALEALAPVDELHAEAVDEDDRPLPG